MIIHESLLKKYFSSSSGYDLSDYENLINNHIIEVEKLEILSKNTHLIIGEILEFTKISQKKKINLVKVNVGSKILSIVCFASNLKANKKVIVASLGSYLEKKKMYIVEKEFDDIKSQGMICSAEELGLPLDILTLEEKEGILFLDDEAPLGTCALEYLGLKGCLLKIVLTPDRSDLLSHVGFAKDLKAVIDNPSIRFKEPFAPSIKEIEEENSFEIKILSENCLEYHIRYLKNIKVDISPLWLRNLLSIYNIESVNNVIDVLNLIMIEYGIPLDAFDVSSLQKDMIIIRNAYPEEKILITEEKQKSFFLTPNDLVIVDNRDQLIAIAGIMNMFKYVVNKQTKDIIITSSYFRPQNILKTSKKINLKNEKILRLTRGIDISLLKKALEKATFLLQKISQAQVTKNIISVQKTKYKNIAINITLEFIRLKTDIVFDMKTIEFFLRRLDYQIIDIFEDSLTVLAPLRRHDIKIKEDIISDLIRLYGYDKIEFCESFSPQLITKTKMQKTLDDLKKLISYLGFFEIITYSLISEKIFNLFTESKNYLEIINPLSHERIRLRHYLSGSLIETLSYNQKRHYYNNAFFEIGKVYKKEEILHLSLGISGTFIQSGWLKQNIESSFFVLKGILERIQFFLNVEFDLVQDTYYHNLHPGKQAHIYFEKEIIGFIGEINPSLCREFHLKPSFILEISLQKILNKKHKKNIFREISRFPFITRDLSFWVAKKYNFQEFFNFFQTNKFPFLFKYELVDLYQDDKINSQQYSLSFRMIFSSMERSLKNDEVQEIMKQIENKLKEKYRIDVR